MCVVSAVTPGLKGLPWKDWDQDQYDSYKRMIEKMKIFDKKTNQPDCETDDNKEILDEIKRYMDKKFKKLEKKIDKKLNEDNETDTPQLLQE